MCPSRGGQSATRMTRDRWKNRQVAAQGEGESFGEGYERGGVGGHLTRIKNGISD